MTAVTVVSIASLNLALEVAHAVFLGRQGQRGPEGLPSALGWLVILAAGLMLYARGEHIAGRVATVIERRWGAL